MGRVSFTVSVIAALAVSTAAQVPLGAQEYFDSPGAAQGERLSPRELDSLLAPIALYPDQLLAPLLMAATYPHDVEAAANWFGVSMNASLRGDSLAFALEGFEWDPSVKTLAQFPDVLRMMNDEWDWMVRVGNAFLLQETSVMDSIQRLRHQSYAMGHLRSNEFRRVRFENGAVVVDMVDPGTIYIPRYDPVRVYGFWSNPDFPPYDFHRPIVVTRYAVVPALWGWSSWEWHRHRIRVDLPRYRYFNRHHPWRYSDDTWRHDRGRRGRDIYFRRDDRRGEWRGDDRRDGRWDRWSDWNRGDRDDRRDWNGRNRPDRDGRGERDDRRERGDPTRANLNPNPAQPQEGDEAERRLHRFRGDGALDAGRGFEYRGQFRQRGERQAYSGPQLTPPTPLAPMAPPAVPQADRDERLRQYQGRREERRQQRREFRAEAQYQSGDAPSGDGNRRRYGRNGGGQDGWGASNFRGWPDGNGSGYAGGNREFRRGGGNPGGEGGGRGRQRGSDRN